MNYLANYYVKNNFLPIANCIGNRIGKGEDYKCDNAIVKNFLDTAAEDPYNLFQTVEQYKSENEKFKKIIEEQKDIIEHIRSTLVKYNRGIENKETRELVSMLLNDSPKELFDLHMAYYNNYMQDSRAMSQFSSEIFEDKFKKDNLKPPKLDEIKDKFEKDKKIILEVIEKNKKNGNPKEFFNKQAKEEGALERRKFLVTKEIVKDLISDYTEHKVHCNLTGNRTNGFSCSKRDSFIDIPKKSNGLMYVIFFILAVFLFRKLKK